MIETRRIVSKHRQSDRNVSHCFKTLLAKFLKHATCFYHFGDVLKQCDAFLRTNARCEFGGPDSSLALAVSSSLRDLLKRGFVTQRLTQLSVQNDVRRIVNKGIKIRTRCCLTNCIESDRNNLGDLRPP